ncbi:MAG TPA: hypothetical protein VEC35_24895 [Noviherbaspirillum sp.]|nr:hypothetical protein [Noviherbaspirillum sp.]
MSEKDLPRTSIVVDSLPPFIVAEHMKYQEGFPLMNWSDVTSWVEGIENPEIQAQVWGEIERAWLSHLRGVLGPEFRLRECDNAILLSSLEDNIALATINYMERTFKRVVKALDGIADVPLWGKDILIVFDDADAYYRYVSCFYPHAGEFAFSSGMHIDVGCSHYVTIKADLHLVEPVIAHEMTHGCLAHLSLPAWLNEGLAVNIERQLTGDRGLGYSPQQLRQMHLKFWKENEVQEFWSGKAFLRTDEGSLLSYDLARVLVEHLAKRWEVFKEFVLAADVGDAGASAADEYLGVDLGELVCTLLEAEPSAKWAPNSQAWIGH